MLTLFDILLDHVNTLVLYYLTMLTLSTCLTLNAGKSSSTQSITYSVSESAAFAMRSACGGRGRSVLPLTSPLNVNTSPLSPPMCCMTSLDTTLGQDVWLVLLATTGTINCSTCIVIEHVVVSYGFQIHWRFKTCGVIFSVPKYQRLARVYRGC